MIIKDVDFINKVWRYYLEYDQVPDLNKFPNTYYRLAGYRQYMSIKFEDWLMREHGATVRQINGILYVEFAIEEQASFFILRFA